LWEGSGMHAATSQRIEEAVLSVRGLCKNYGRIAALSDVDLELRRGEILAVVGDNGAGKSTLLRILSGDLAPTTGEIVVGSKPVAFQRPADATAAGIGSVYQDLSLALELGIAANFFSGREIFKGGRGLRWLHWLDKKRMEQVTAEALRGMRIRIVDPSVECSSLSGGQRQALAIGRAMHWSEHVLLLDEPTAALGVEQQRQTLDLMRQSRDRGAAIIFVSHQLPHVLEVADRTVVLRRGRLAGHFSAAETTEHALLSAITGLVARPGAGPGASGAGSGGAGPRAEPEDQS
jgi:ABC-type sugar transport system ATPase subunit